MFRRSFHFLKALLFLLGIFASANLSASNGEFDGESRITRERSGLFAGDGGFDIHVGDATSLTGAVIHSEATPDQNRLKTGSLDAASLEDVSKWSLETGSVSLSGSYNGGGTNGVGMGLPSSDGDGDTRTVASGIGLREGLGYALTSDKVGWSPEQASGAQTIFDAAAAVAAFKYASPGGGVAAKEGYAFGEILPNGRVAGIGPGASENLSALARKFNLNVNSPASRQVLENLNTPVREFISTNRLGSIRAEFPSQYLDSTVAQALKDGGSTVRKLLIDGRFAK